MNEKHKKLIKKRVNASSNVHKNLNSPSPSLDDLVPQSGRKIIDSEVLIKEIQARVKVVIKKGIEYPPFEFESEQFLRQHVSSRIRIIVLYVDMVGSTYFSLILPDEKIVKIITIFAQEMAYGVTQFDGYVLKFVGDGIIAYFNVRDGVPSPAENILNCAKFLIHVIEQGINPILSENGYPTLKAKIGIAYGENIVVRYGSDEIKSHVDILGPSMNVAAKLQAKAKPNQILVGEGVYDRLHPETQKSFKKKPISETGWKYYHPKTGELYQIYEYFFNDLVSKK